MFDWFKRAGRKISGEAVRLAIFAGILSAGLAVAQQFTLPNNSVVQGHLIANQVGAVPVGTTCTIAAGSTDTWGRCATTSTAAVVTFGTAYTTAPMCLVTDATSVSATSMPIYTVSATAITLSTVITAHTLFWACVGVTGG